MSIDPLKDPLRDPVPATERATTRDALQRPMHDLRISLLDRCNFRCPYCMPASEYHEDYEFLSRPERLTHDEILAVARAAAGLGVTKLRITGGEPLLDRKLPDLVAGLAALPGVEDLAMTTNAMLLAPVADRLAEAGLHRVTISLDSLDEAVFLRMSGGRGDLARVLAGIEASEPPVVSVVLDMESIYDIDSTGAQMLIEMLDALDELGIGCAMARVRTELRDEFLTIGLEERLAGDGVYLEVDDAVEAYLRRDNESPDV